MADPRSDTRPCECGHDMYDHGVTGLCLHGYNAAIVQYRQYDYDRRGERKCLCNDYRAARTTQGGSQDV